MSVLCLVLLLETAPVRASELRLSEWLEKVSLSGDLRLRQENFDKKSPGQVDRSRQRFRLRVATDFAFPHHLEAKFRFASGTGEQFSTNQSFDNLSGQKGIWVDRAYLQWMPRGYLKLAGGRMANPFWTSYASDAVWDEDFNPEGFSQSVEWLLRGGTKLFANALQMVADEDSDTNTDQWMFGEQFGVELLLPGEAYLRLAGAYYNWAHETNGTFGQSIVNEGNRRTGASSNPFNPGTLQNEFGVAELSGEVSTRVADLPLSLLGTFLKNTEAKESLIPMEDTGYQLGGRLGKTGAAGSWEAAYFYKWVETDATVADVADADFGDGGTNRRGHIFWGAYNPAEWLQFKVKCFVTRVIKESLAPNADDINRFQMDLSAKF